MKIQSRLLILTISMPLIAMVFALLASTYLIHKFVISTVSEKLETIVEARYNAMEQELDTIYREMQYLSVSIRIKHSLISLSEGFDKLGSNAQTQVQQDYFVKNNTDQIAKPLAFSGSAYDQAYEIAYPLIKEFNDIFGWESLFLIDPRGNVIFSLLKDPVLGTNLISGPWKDTGLAEAATRLLHAPVPGVISFADFSHYKPQENRPTAFVSISLFDPDKRVFLGVVMVQLPMQKINELMREHSGLGKSGETLVVGKDGWMLSNSRYRNADSLLSKQIRSVAVIKALKGESGVEELPDYRDVDCIVAYKPIHPFQNKLILGDPVSWGILAKIDKAEVNSVMNELFLQMLWITGILGIGAAVISWWGARNIALPLSQITEALTRLSLGKETVIPCQDRSDEIGEMANAADNFLTVTQQLDHEHWVAENISELFRVISEENSVSKAADSLLHLLCNKLDVPVGAIYLLDKDSCCCVGSHGLARRSQPSDVFPLGVGMIGQCAKDNQALVLSPVPSGLSIISTGLAEFPPHELVFYPIAQKDEVVAVLELAAAKSLDSKQHELLKAVSSKLGLNLVNLQVAEHNLLLLNQTSKLSEELRSNALYARSLLESTLDPLVTIGPDGKIMDVNTATEKVTGVSRDRLIGSDFCTYFTQPELAQSGYKQVFTQGYVTDYPLAIRHVSGRITDVLYNASIFRDEEGNVAGIFAAARDVTYKKQVDAKLQEQQEELLKSNNTLVILNEEMRSQSEVMKTQNEELKVSQEELLAQQSELKDKNNLLVTQSNMLEELVAEAKVKAEDLQRANRYKSEFLANMSHELRTPLNSVLILAKNLAENEEKNLLPGQIESATVIQESGTQLLNLINDILDLSKIEAGKMALQKAPFSLNEVLVYLQQIFSPQAELKHLALTIQSDPSVPETIISDRQRLTQVLSNLLSNAIKFTERGEVSLRVSQEKQDLLLTVIDNGIGIPADKLDDIFGAFQQVDGTNTRKYGGSGLGLTISRHLTELLGGQIEVNSQLGKGSCFTIRLLKACCLENGKVDLLEPQVSLGQIGALNTQSNILVVEDDAQLLMVLGRMIKSLGYTPVCVESAEQAMKQLDKGEIMGAFLDLGLPKMSGMEMLRRLKMDKATAKIPVYIMSAVMDQGEAILMGALGFLTKPVTREAIAGAIKSMLSFRQGGSIKRILLVDEELVDFESMQTFIDQNTFEIAQVNTGNAALEMLKTQGFDAVILDLKLPDMTGFEWLKQACDQLNPPPVVVISADELTEDEVFRLKEFTESVINKKALGNRLREEVLRAVQLSSIHSNIVTTVNTSGSRKTLLVVDDDARNLFALTKVLRAKGFTIEAVSDSVQALEMLKLKHFNAVLTDIMMPKVDGYKLISQIRELGYTDIPIIAITAKAMQGDDELCFKAGATAYLAKPVDMDKLVALLKGI